jgi:hypothetical protein
MKRGAYISPCGTYRYSLEREWAEGPVCTFIMLNPSTADADIDDPTIRRCIGFAQRWKFGALAVVNLFAFRATDPKAMIGAVDPVGPANDAAIASAVELGGLIIAAWGVHGDLRERGLAVRRLIEEGCERDIHHLGLTKDGHPRHPLYLRGDSQPERWSR